MKIYSVLLLLVYPLLLYGFQTKWNARSYRDTGNLVQDHSLISNETSSYIQHIFGEWNSTGIALAVIQKDETLTDPAHPGWRIEFGSYGNASTYPFSRPITPDTLFSIASNSKLFLSLSVGLLVHNKTLGKEFKATHGVELGWKTRMRDLLGDSWEMWDEDVTRGATIADLLSHRTGLPRHDYMRVWRNGGVREEIQKLRYLRPSAELRETFQYNNLMYETLSYLPELLLNQTYELYVAEHLLEPLNMTSTTFSVAEVYEYPPRGRFAHRMAQGHIASERNLIHGKPGTLKPIIPFFSRPGEERTRGGAGGVISTARDLSTWNAMLLSNGRHPYTNATVVPPEVLEWITTGRSILTGVPSYPDTSPIVYNAGQLRFSYRGLDVVEHDGDNPGFKSAVSRFPQKGLGVVVLSNDGDNGGRVMAVAKWAVVDDLEFGETADRVDWNKRFHSAVDAQHKAQREKATPRPPKPALPTKPFWELGAKKFQHPAYGEIALCRVPPHHFRGPRSSPFSEVSFTVVGSQHPLPFHSDIDDGYENPYTNCTQLLSSPSVRHILSSTSPPLVPGADAQRHSSRSGPPETFIASFPHSFVSHLYVSHFSGNLFNVSAVWVNDDIRRDVGALPPSSASSSLSRDEPGSSEDPGAVLTNLDETFTLEWVSGSHSFAPVGVSCDDDEEGLAIRGGFWGMAGPDAREPVGAGREAAEVWFRVGGE